MLNRKEKTLSFSEKLRSRLNSVGNLVFIVIIFLLVSSIMGNVRRARIVNSKVAEKEAELERLKKEQTLLEENLKKVNSQEYIEQQLRDNLGMSKEGEIVVVLPDPEIVKKFAPKEEEEKEIVPDPNWKRWMKLFGF